MLDIRYATDIRAVEDLMRFDIAQAALAAVVGARLAARVHILRHVEHSSRLKLIRKTLDQKLVASWIARERRELGEREISVPAIADEDNAKLPEKHRKLLVNTKLAVLRDEEKRRSDREKEHPVAATGSCHDVRTGRVCGRDCDAARRRAADQLEHRRMV